MFWLTLVFVLVPVVEAPPPDLPKFQVTMADGTVLHGQFMHPTLSIKQPYGTLTVPLEDIKNVSTRIRVTDADNKKAHKAITDMLSTDSATKANGWKMLQVMKRKVYPQCSKMYAAALERKDKQQIEALQQIFQSVNAIAGYTETTDSFYTKRQERVVGEIVETTIPFYTESIGIVQVQIEELVNCTQKDR